MDEGLDDSRADRATILLDLTGVDLAVLGTLDGSVLSAALRRIADEALNQADVAAGFASSI